MGGAIGNRSINSGYSCGRSVKNEVFEKMWVHEISDLIGEFRFQKPHFDRVSEVRKEMVIYPT